MINGARVRRDIWKLEDEQDWHPITRAYALAVGVLQKRDAAKPTSWTWQTQIHGLPGFARIDPYRGQCQHNSWFFLPWHRCYLHWFERIVRSVVATLDEVDQATKDAWALPYWNPSDVASRRRLPQPFLEERLDGEPNPLFVRNRNPLVNRGEPIDERAARLDGALPVGPFAEKAPAVAFGGAPTTWNHLDDDPNANPGPLEITPHGSVHGQVGGWMGQFHSAARDPVFWMHHANIDRLWVVWRRQKGCENPSPTSAWGTEKFHFHDEKEAPVVCTAADVLETTDLGYTYEETDPPRRRRSRSRVKPEPPENPPELVGATDEPLELTGGRADVTFDVGRPKGPAAARGGDPARVYLSVEGIESDGETDATYAVYLNLPDGEDPDDDPEVFYAGNVDLFGIEGVGRVDTDHPARPLRRSFDITELVAELRDEGAWDPRSLSVTFTPLRRGRSGRGSRGIAEDAGATVRVARIGLYYR